MLYQAGKYYLYFTDIETEILSVFWPRSHIQRMAELEIKYEGLILFLTYLTGSLERWIDMEKDWSQKNSQGMSQCLK